MRLGMNPFPSIPRFQGHRNGFAAWSSCADHGAFHPAACRARGFVEARRQQRGLLYFPHGAHVGRGAWNHWAKIGKIWWDMVRRMAFFNLEDKWATTCNFLHGILLLIHLGDIWGFLTSQFSNRTTVWCQSFCRNTEATCKSPPCPAKEAQCWERSSSEPCAQCAQLSTSPPKNNEEHQARLSTVACQVQFCDNAILISFIGLSCHSPLGNHRPTQIFGNGWQIWQSPEPFPPPQHHRAWPCRKERMNMSKTIPRWTWHIRSLN